MNEPNNGDLKGTDEDPVELDSFDIRQVHLVRDPANGRRILTQKGVRMATQNDPAANSDGADDTAADPTAQAAGDQAAAAAKKPKTLKMASPLRGAMLAMGQELGEKVANFLSMVDGAEATDDMTMPSEVSDMLMGMQQSMDLGMQPFAVAKARAPQVSSYVRGMLDTFRAALDSLPTGESVQAEPAPAAAAAVPTPEPVTKSVEAQLQAFKDELKAEMEKKEATIKSLQDDLQALRRSPASSSVLGSGAPSAPASPRRLSSQDFPDLNEFVKYQAAMDAADAAARQARR